MGANFTPTLDGYSGQGAFRFWCQKVLPLVYDDSLSYMELLNKVVVYLNNTISDVANVETNVGRLATAFEELQDYVNDYFDNLDVVSIVEEKLDEMASDGTLSALIQPLFDEFRGEIDSDIAVLQARMDSFASLPDGSTSGDAELTDIRVSSSGYTYPSAGDSVRAQFRINSNSAYSATNVNYVPEYSLITGKCISSSDLSILSISTYEMTTPILVRPKELITCFATGSNGIAIMALCDPDGTPTSVINVGSSDVAERIASYLNNTTTNQYVICSGGISQGIVIKTYCEQNDPEASLDKRQIQSLYYRNDGTVQPVAILNTWKAGTYVCTTPIALKAGETIHMMADVSSSIPAIIKCDINGGNRVNVVTGAGTRLYDYRANEDCYVMCQYYANNTYTFISKSENWNDNGNNNDSRHPVITFIFDDGVTEDSDIVDIFEAKNLKCGFALVSTIATSASEASKINNYLNWQKIGYSILSHSTDGTGMNDPSVSTSAIRDKLLLSKQRLNAAGFDIKGWVTPSSQMAESFRPLLNSLYDYAYTIYYGSYSSSNPCYNTFNEGSYNMWRLDLMNTYDNIVAGIDACISNKGFLTIYCHAAQMQPSHFTLLADVLDYINGKIASYDVKCLAPNDAYDYYFNVRKEDLV